MAMRTSLRKKEHETLTLGKRLRGQPEKKGEKKICKI